MTKKAVVGAGSAGLSAAELYGLWAVAPYGVKTGLLPIFLLAFALTHTDHIAIYRDGMFEPKLTDVDADELLQDPRRFSLRWVIKNTDHVAALESIASTLTRCGFAPKSISALGVSRNLVKLVFSLSFWAKRTQRVSPQARAVRDILLRASDPNRLLLIDLPNTLGVSALEVGATIEPLLKELLEAYPKMLHSVDQSMAVSIDALEGDDPELRERAESISKFTGDLRLQGFSARLLQRDGSLAAIESILSLAANKPPRDWTDLDIDSAIFSIADLALAFRRAETLVNVQGRAVGREAFAVVIGAGGSSQVVTKTFQLAGRDKKTVQKAADTILLQLEQMGLQGDLIFAALARAGSVSHEKEAKNG